MGGEKRPVARSLGFDFARGRGGSTRPPPASKQMAEAPIQYAAAQRIPMEVLSSAALMATLTLALFIAAYYRADAKRARRREGQNLLGRAPKVFTSCRRRT